MKQKKILPLMTVERIMKLNGAYRVSEDSKEELRDILEEKAAEITKKAIEYAKHAKRSTIKKTDIKLAARLI
ncbi:MAG: NFYB/HAP3 family transcription factor subunit [Candidatus Woesearchaeota archaeon]